MADIILVMPVANRFDKVSIRIPNGLLAVAALPVSKGYSVKIIDLKVDDDWRGTLRSEIDENTICAGITCSTGRMIRSALEVARQVREIDPELPIVWGGPHPTLLPEQTLKHPLVDTVVINEGDITFMEVIDVLSRKGDLSVIDGIGYKKNGEIKITSPRPLVKDIDELLDFPYHLLDVRKYSSLNVDNLPSIDILTSRGCPYNCGFCSTPLTSQRKWRSRSVDRIVADVTNLKQKYGIRTFYSVDDNLMVDLKRVDMLLDALKAANLDIYWGTQGVRVDTINRMSTDLLDKIERSGCKELSIGVESANPEILRLIDKRIKVEDVLLANEKLAGRDFAVKFNMIIGFPGETIAGIKKTVDLAVNLYRKNKRAWFPFNIFTPFPGTPMFNVAVQNGFTPPDELEKWDKLEAIGWDRYYGHWMTKKENDLLRSINAASYLAFPSAAQKITNPTIKILFNVYRPMAYFRFKNMFYYFHFEKRLLEEGN